MPPIQDLVKEYLAKSFVLSSQALDHKISDLITVGTYECDVLSFRSFIQQKVGRLNQVTPSTIAIVSHQHPMLAAYFKSTHHCQKGFLSFSMHLVQISVIHYLQNSTFPE